MRNAHAADVQEREAREREARIQEAREAMERARRSRGLVYFASRLLLGLSLVLVGVTLAAGRWKNLSEPVEVTLTALEGQRVLIGLAAIALAIIDIVLDLSVARPVIGDGLPQIAALLAGLTATKALVPDHAVLSRVREAIETLDVHKERLGIAAIAVGAIHLVAGIYPLI